MYPSSTTTITLPSLSLHLGNLPGFEFSSDRETPISNPPSSVFSNQSATSSAAVSPLSILSTTPANPSDALSGQLNASSNSGLQRATTMPMVSLPPISRLPAPLYGQLPESFQRCSFVDSLVDTGALVIESIWPNQIVPAMNSKILPLRVFIQETIRRSQTSFSTLQLALYYLLRIRPAVQEFEAKNPEWFSVSCKFGKTASKHPIACGRRMFLAAVIVASKYLQDRNYSNRAWAKLSSLQVKEINANEFVFLNVVKYDLYVEGALYKRWSAVLLNHVMATVSGSISHCPVGLSTPPLTPVMSPLHSNSSGAIPRNPLRVALAQRFCDAIRKLSPLLTEAELTSLHVLGFQSPQQKSMSPPPSRNGLGQRIVSRSNCSPSLLHSLSPPRSPYDTSLTPPTTDSPNDSPNGSDLWSPRSSVSSASSNDSANISPRTNIGRSYLKTLGCANNASNTENFSQSCINKRCISPLSIIASRNDRKRNTPPPRPLSSHMEDVRQTIPATPRLEQDATPFSSMVEEDQDWSSAGTIDPKLLQLNSSALTAVKGLCFLSQRPTVFRTLSRSSSCSSTFVHGNKRTFGKSYSMGDVQSEAKRRCGAISEQTLARML